MQKISNSLSVKVFLWVLCVLTACCLLIYSLVMIILPDTYISMANSRIEENVNQLTQELDGIDLDAVQEKIYNFCIDNQAFAMLQVDTRIISFGDNDETTLSSNTLTMSTSVRLSDCSEDALLTIVTSSSAAGDITHTFLKLLPLIIFVILILSTLSAWVCSRIIVRPILSISRVSKRMAQIDMTWRCDVRRTDELGVLADSLNTLSERLTQTMGELESANEQLRNDVVIAQTLEKQRRDFFTAAGHELKTPLTILRGQLESMMLNIGDYKNHEKYFPQSLVAIENMEKLVREILYVSKMENGIPADYFTDEPLLPIVASCVREIAPLAEKKKLQIEIIVPEDIHVYIYKELFSKAISNLLSNAVRYSPDENKVIIKYSENQLSIENTGVSIPEEEQGRLFAPFYRIDKSRNRESGGSGLGLYIVKTILELHGFGCKAIGYSDSVCFIINLNQN